MNRAFPVLHAPTAPARRRVSAVSARWQDLALCVGLGALALWVRLPGLLDVPEFTDETEEVRRAVEIAHGELFPLVNVDSYIGAWNNYLTAAALRLVGSNIAVARGVTLALGVLTVALCYALARQLGLSRPAALLAGALLTTSGAHAIVGSHVAWSNCTTPFYTTLAALLLERAVRRGDPRWLAGAGLASGIALQTHPTALLPLLGLAGYGLWAGGRLGWRWSRWTTQAGLGLAVGYSPLLVYNVQTRFDSLRHALVIRNAYEEHIHHAPFSVAVYLDNLRSLLLGLGRVLASSFTEGPETLADRAVWIAAAFALAGLGWALWRGWTLLPLSLLATTLLLPLIDPKYNLVMNGRYLLPLLPLVIVAQAGLAEAIGRWAWRFAAPPTLGWRSALGGVTLLAVLALVGWSLLAPLDRLSRFERAAMAMPYNAAMRSLAAQIEAARRPGEPILLDARLSRVDPPGFPRIPDRGLILRVLFDLADVPNTTLLVNPELVDAALPKAPGASALLVLVPDSYWPDPPLLPGVEQMPIPIDQPYQAKVYRLTRRP